MTEDQDAIAPAPAPAEIDADLKLVSGQAEIQLSLSFAKTFFGFAYQIGNLCPIGDSALTKHAGEPKGYGLGQMKGKSQEQEALRALSFNDQVGSPGCAGVLLHFGGQTSRNRGERVWR